ncbi:DUF305 domain-containing protein [Comamonas sp. NLF-1-9]|uniref:DUF305 domain-containing protein n=1 Tax=Comamonas sp. NLF-1-9 TaxID=2853163 RepID=UPI001C450F45|nr:DUF305 domain-containing protein [Comamonas sp. NLF-1-9]QXL83793.1 DUF305 domain-containing protein [Comamonas sp. NLF-1-9]
MPQQSHQHSQESMDHGGHAHQRPYLMLWVNLALSLIVMYVVMFTMINGWADFHNNINMLYMAVTMWAPMGIFMLLTMGGMYSNRKANLVLYILFAVLTAASFWATRSQALVHDRQFILSMVPHHSGAILMCRKATLQDAELIALCRQIEAGQRSEIEQMQNILARLEAQGR